MTTVSPPPATLELEQALESLTAHGHAVCAATSWAPAWGLSPADLERLAASWSDLPPDAYLRDGGRYRRRRHGCWWSAGDGVSPPRAEPHRAHWQPVSYNALHGGIERWFEPVQPPVALDGAWLSLLSGIAACATALRGAPAAGRWAVEAHQFRIDTTDGIGRPTPEGAHRDGVDLVAVVLVARHAIRGGETRVFEAGGPRGLRFTLDEPWSLLLLDDARVIHETTPIQPQVAGPGAADVALGWRDTLVVTCRGDGFQAPGSR
jgi:hypothetical protein